MCVGIPGRKEDRNSHEQCQCLSLQPRFRSNLHSHSKDHQISALIQSQYISFSLLTSELDSPNALTYLLVVKLNIVAGCIK